MYMHLYWRTQQVWRASTRVTQVTQVSEVTSRSKGASHCEFGGGSYRGEATRQGWQLWQCIAHWPHTSTFLCFVCQRVCVWVRERETERVHARVCVRMCVCVGGCKASNQQVLYTYTHTLSEDSKRAINRSCSFMQSKASNQRVKASNQRVKASNQRIVLFQTINRVLLVERSCWFMILVGLKVLLV